MSFKIVYTLSDKRDMVKEILKSLKSLRRFVDKSDIDVFYTPPRTQRTYRKLRAYATVCNRPNITTPFVFDPLIGKGNYGEKIHLCDVPFSTVIFLDCDTTINKDITELLAGDYDFSGRRGRENLIKWDVWSEFCQSLGEYPPFIYNAGFMIFKNELHTKIKEDWARFFALDIPHIYKTPTYTKEEYALSLALPDETRIKDMTEKEHFCAWIDKGKDEPYVRHGYERSPWRRLKMRLKYA